MQSVAPADIGDVSNGTVGGEAAHGSADSHITSAAPTSRPEHEQPRHRQSIEQTMAAPSQPVGLKVGYCVMAKQL